MNKHLLFAALLLCFVGCSKNVGMSGKVTFSDDGSPLTTGMICFQSATALSRGHMKEDGTFVIGSGTDASGMPRFKSLLDLKYTSPEETPLKISVNGKQKIELQVERPETDTFITPKL